MKALVTGSNGFVGRHMTRALKDRGHDVYEWDLPKQDAIEMFSDSGVRFTFDLVVHCAYRVGGRKEIDSSRVNLAYNLALDVALFRWAMRNKPGRILYFSSSAVYPVEYQTKEITWHLYEGMAGRNPDADYGFAKMAGERLARNYAASGGIVHVVRPFSGYGSDQSEDYPFPKFVARAKAKKNPFEVWGDPTSLRDWIHIDDVVAASLAVIDKDYREPVNLCTGIGTTFAALAVLCMQAAGYAASIKAIDGPMGVHTRVGNSGRMNGIYKPKITIEEGVRRAFT